MKSTGLLLRRGPEDFKEEFHPEAKKGAMQGQVGLAGVKEIPPQGGSRHCDDDAEGVNVEIQHMFLLHSV